MMFPALHTLPVGLRASQRKLRALPPAVTTAVATIVLLLLLAAGWVGRLTFCNTARGMGGGRRAGGDGSTAAGRLRATARKRERRVQRVAGAASRLGTVGKRLPAGVVAAATAGVPRRFASAQSRKEMTLPGPVGSPRPARWGPHPPVLRHGHPPPNAAIATAAATDASRGGGHDKPPPRQRQRDCPKRAHVPTGPPHATAWSGTVLVPHIFFFTRQATVTGRRR